MAIPLALALAPAAIQTGMGIYQTVQGNRLRNSMDRPNYEIPQEILDSLTDAQIQALRGMPAEQKQQYVDNVMRSQQASLDAMGDRKGGLAGLAGVQQTAIDAYRNMLSMDAQQRQANEQALQNTRGVVAGFKDKAFDYNQAQPYDQTMAAAEAMTGSGIQNTFGGIQAGSQMGLDAVMFNQYMNGIGGSGSTVPTTVASTTATVPTTPTFPPPNNMGIYNQGQTSPFNNDFSFGDIYNNSSLSYNPGNTFKLPR